MENLVELALEITGLNQKQLAEKIGVSTGQISKWKNGEAIPESREFELAALIVELRPNIDPGEEVDVSRGWIDEFNNLAKRIPPEKRMFDVDFKNDGFPLTFFQKAMVIGIEIPEEPDESEQTKKILYFLYRLIRDSAHTLSWINTFLINDRSNDKVVKLISWLQSIVVRKLTREDLEFYGADMEMFDYYKKSGDTLIKPEINAYIQMIKKEGYPITCDYYELESLTSKELKERVSNHTDKNELEQNLTYFEKESLKNQKEILEKLNLLLKDKKVESGKNSTDNNDNFDFNYVDIDYPVGLNEIHNLGFHINSLKNDLLDFIGYERGDVEDFFDLMMLDSEERSRREAAVGSSPIITRAIGEFLQKTRNRNGYVESVIKPKEGESKKIYSLVNDLFIDGDLLPESEVIIKAKSLATFESDNENDKVAKTMIHLALLQAIMREVYEEKNNRPIKALDGCDDIGDLDMSIHSFCRLKIYLDIEDSYKNVDRMDELFCDMIDLTIGYSQEAQQLDEEFFKAEVTMMDFDGEPHPCVVIDIADDHSYGCVEEFTDEILVSRLDDDFKDVWRVEEINPIDCYIKKFAHNVSIIEEFYDVCDESDDECEYKCEAECRKGLLPKPAEVIKLNPVVVIEKTRPNQEEVDESDLARFEFNTRKQAEILTSVKSQRTYVLESKEYDDEKLEIINLIIEYNLGNIIYL